MKLPNVNMNLNIRAFKSRSHSTQYLFIYILKTKARHLNPVDGDQIVDFITHLDQHNKMLLLLGGLQLPFDNLTANSIKRFVAAAVGKIYKIRMGKVA